MHHKLQSSSSKNHGKNSVVRKQQAKTNRQKSRKLDAGARSGSKKRPSKRLSNSSTRDSLNRKQKSRSGRATVVRDRQAQSGKRSRLGERPRPIPEQTGAARERKDFHDPTTLRCEVPHSAEFDPTGERAFACGARAEVICETCGPMCARCAQETFCQGGEHKLSSLPELEPKPIREQSKRPVTPVIYVELRCPKRCRVRLALPQTHRVQPKRKCPVCQAMAPTKYLAHGFTRRQLPFHEVWTDEDEFIKGGEPSEDPDFKRRVPWDSRENSQQTRRR